MTHSQFRRRLPLAAGLALVAGLGASGAHATLPAVPPAGKPLNLHFCVFDVLGTRGQVYQYAQDLALAARKWQVNATVTAYSDERIAADDFQAGQCDGLAVTTIRARQFNPFVGSIDAIGAAPSYRHIEALAATFSNPRVAPLTIRGDYQVITVVPLGAAYVMVNNRHIDSVDKAAGKKIAVLDSDKAQTRIVQRLGAQPVAANLYNFANLFNNGQVDVITAPAIAFKPLELAKGMGDYGGIYRFPLTQVTGAILINRTRLAHEVPDLDQKIEKIRAFALKEMTKTIGYIEKQEHDIPAQYWLTLPPGEQARYQNLMREARLQLTKEGVYDPRMMALMKRIRCKLEPASGECALTD